MTKGKFILQNVVLPYRMLIDEIIQNNIYDFIQSANILTILQESFYNK